MKFRKIISILIMVVMSFSVTLVYAESTDSSDLSMVQKYGVIPFEKIPEPVKKQEKAVKQYEQIVHKLEGSKDYAEKYAGSFIDEKGVLNINVVGDSKKLLADVDLNEIKINNVSYSLEQLEKIQSNYTDKIGSDGILMVMLDDRTNKVIVIIDENELSKFNEIKEESLNFVDGGAVEIVQGTFSPTATTLINGNLMNNTRIASTIGFGVSKGSKTGFVTTAHGGLAVGDNIYINSTLIGRVVSKQLGGNTDSAYVECNSSYIASKTFMNGESYASVYADSTTYNLNTYVERYGARTGKATGYIKGTANISYEGVTVAAVCATMSTSSIAGDSGGAYTYYRYAGSGSATRHVMGVHIGDITSGTTQYAIFSRATNAMSAHGLGNL